MGRLVYNPTRELDDERRETALNFVTKTVFNLFGLGG